MHPHLVLWGPSDAPLHSCGSSLYKLSHTILSPTFQLAQRSKQDPLRMSRPAPRIFSVQQHSCRECENALSGWGMHTLALAVAVNERSSEGPHSTEVFATNHSGLLVSYVVGFLSGFFCLRLTEWAQFATDRSFVCSAFNTRSYRPVRW
jgi:hypothetical protein